MLKKLNNFKNKLVTKFSSFVGKFFRRFSPINKWVKKFSPTEKTLEIFRSKAWPKDKPNFLIILVLSGSRTVSPEWSINSIKNQTYKNWHLLIANLSNVNLNKNQILSKASNIEFRQFESISSCIKHCVSLNQYSHLLFMTEVDCLQPHFLHRHAEEILENNPDLIYSDEAEVADIDINCVKAIISKPAFSYTLFLGNQYFNKLTTIKAEIFKKVSFTEYICIENTFKEIIIRCLELSLTVSHIPDILSKCIRAEHQIGLKKPNLLINESKIILENHFSRICQKAKIQHSVFCKHSFTVTPVVSSQNQIAIIIPTRDKIDLIRPCIESLKKTLNSSLNVKIIIVNHMSKEKNVLDFFEELGSFAKVINYFETFNYAKMMNWAVDQIKTDNFTHYLFLNDDILAVQNNWLENMLNLFSFENVGIVGANLLYADNSIQHSGVIIGLGGLAGHALRFHPYLSEINSAIIHLDRDCSAVTGACMLVNRMVFDLIDGFDENFKVAYNDVDFCLRAKKAGFKILLSAQSVLYHFESQSRGTGKIDLHPEDSSRFLRLYKQIIDQGDPYYSPYLDHEGFSHLPRPGAKCPLEVQTRLESTPWAASIRTQRKDAA